MEDALCKVEADRDHLADTFALVYLEYLRCITTSISAISWDYTKGSTDELGKLLRLRVERLAVVRRLSLVTPFTPRVLDFCVTLGRLETILAKSGRESHSLHTFREQPDSEYATGAAELRIKQVTKREHVWMAIYCKRHFWRVSRSFYV